MSKVLSVLINLGGLLNGSKTVLGIVSVAVAILQHLRPDVAEIVLQVLQWFGVSLLPIGIADKIRKASSPSWKND